MRLHFYTSYYNDSFIQELYFLTCVCAVISCNLKPLSADLLPIVPYLVVVWLIICS